MTHTVAGVAHHVYIRDTPFTKGKTHTGAQMGKNGEKCTRKKKGKKKRAKRERAELAGSCPPGSCEQACADSERRKKNKKRQRVAEPQHTHDMHTKDPRDANPITLFIKTSTQKSCTCAVAHCLCA
jgi:hypothetical protein